MLCFEMSCKGRASPILTAADRPGRHGWGTAASRRLVGGGYGAGVQSGALLSRGVELAIAAASVVLPLQAGAVTYAVLPDRPS